MKDWIVAGLQWLASTALAILIASVIVYATIQVCLKLSDGDLLLAVFMAGTIVFGLALIGTRIYIGTLLNRVHNLEDQLQSEKEASR